MKTCKTEAKMVKLLQYKCSLTSAGMGFGSKHKERHSISEANSVTFTNFMPHVLLSSKDDIG